MRDLRVDVGGIALQIREYEREGDTVIFLHFGGGNLMMWERAVPYFQDHYRLLLVDLRDHGKSDKPQSSGHIDDMARDVAGVMEYLKIERAHIIGSSLGAEVGLSLAANFPEQVTSLVCEGALCSEYGPYGVWDGSEAEFKEHVARTLAEVHNGSDQVFTSVSVLVEARKQVFEKHGWWNQYVEAFLEYDAFEVSKGHFTRSWQKMAREKYLEHYFACRFEDYYERVKCPVLMLPGEDDMQDERTKIAMKGLSQLVSKGKIVAVPGWVHPYGWLLDPEEISKVILGFLAEVHC
jgi:2-succinyl-6-hydroxy-2,4-cyclohexadiene-1-carboxylate synthase